MTTASRVVVMLALLAGTANAGLIKAPDGWSAPTRNAKTAQVYVPPGDQPPIELVVAATTQTLVPEHRADAARAALDDFHGMARRAALTGSNVAEDNWQERTDATAKVIDAALAWRDPGAKVSETARMVIAGDATQLVAATGECIARDEATPALVAACKAALATLDPGIALADRVVPALAPEGTPPREPPAGGPAPHPAPTMSEGTHAPLPPITIPQDAPTGDRKPVFIGAGIVLLAGVFWWNMRRRARHELEDQGEPR